MKTRKYFRRKNGVKGISFIWSVALVLNMVATASAMAYSVADYAARIDPVGLGVTMKMASTVPAVANSIDGPAQGGGGDPIPMYLVDVTVPESKEWQMVWVPPIEGYPGYWEWQWVTIPEHIKTVPMTGEELEKLMSTEEPIDTMTGNNYFTESRLFIPCSGIPLVVGLKYQSVTNMPSGLLGKGWHHSYEWMLDAQDTNHVVVHPATGGKMVFELGTNGLYQSPEESDWTLEDTGAGYEAILPKQGLAYSFDTNGLLITIHDEWENWVDCSYGTNNCLEAVTHVNGRKIVFSNEWNVTSGEWRVAGMQVVGGVGLGFAYNSGGQLSQTVEQVGANSFTSSYQYADSFLTNKVNGAGFEYTFGYEEENGVLNGKGTYLAVDGYYEHDVSYADFSTDVTYHRRGTNQIFRYSRNNEGKPTATYGPAASIANIELRGRRYTYAPNGKDTAEETLFDDTTGATWTKWMLYDDAHNVTNFLVSYGTTNPVQQLSMEYDPVSQLSTAVVDADGLRLEVIYTNGLPLIEKAFHSISNSYDTHYAYTTNGLVQAVTNAIGHVSSFGYDAMGNMTGAWMELGPIATNTFDALGFVQSTEILSESGASTGRISQYDNDAKGRVVKTTFADGLTNSFAYNALGYLTNTIDRAGRHTNYTYAPTEKLTSVTRWLKQGGSMVPVRTGYDLDEQVNILRISEPRGLYVESYQLDIQDRVTAVTNIEGQVMVIDYSIGSFLNGFVRFDDSTITNTYDSAGLLETTTCNPGSVSPVTIAYRYYSDGLPESISDGTTTISNLYNQLNRLTNQVIQVGNLQSENGNAFDSVGNVTNSVVSIGGSQVFATTYSYDAAERLSLILTSRTNSASSAFTHSYSLVNGLLESVSNSVFGITCAYAHDIMDRVTNMTYRTANGSLIRSLDYAYDAAAMITNTTIVGGTTSVSSSYEYDSLNRLVSETSFATSVPLREVFYSYDLAGNRLVKTINGLGVAYTLGAGNRLAYARTIATIDIQGSSSESIGNDDRWGELWVSNLSAQVGWVPETAGFDFWIDNMPLEVGTNQLVAALRDQAGNMDYTTNTVHLSAANTNVQYGYSAAGCVTNLNGVALEWDERYRLKSVEGASCSVAYEYDVLDRRISRIENGTTNFFIYTDSQIVADLDENWGLLRSYVWGIGIDNLLCFTDHTTSNTYYAIKDHQNTVIALIDSSDTMVEAYEYDAYGETKVFDASGIELTESAVGNRYCFQGREIEWDTGLYYFRARWYNPEVGRWLSKDPIGTSGGLNQYVFADNNPVMFVDPSGLASIGSRPLDRNVWFNGRGALRHDQIWYDNGDNSGFFDTDDIREDAGHTHADYNFSRDTRNYNDDLMRESEKNVQETWDMDWRMPLFGDWNNCQDYINAVREEYYRLKNE